MPITHPSNFGFRISDFGFRREGRPTVLRLSCPRLGEGRSGFGIFTQPTRLTNMSGYVGEGFIPSRC